MAYTRRIGATFERGIRKTCPRRAGVACKRIGKTYIRRIEVARKGIGKTS
jgi:hypothetical protein